jgi:hypothetical protein
MTFDILHELGSAVRPDDARTRRTGMPEVVLAEGKSTAQCVTAARMLLEREGRAIVSRASAEVLQALHAAFPGCVEPGAMGSRRLVTAVVRDSVRGVVVMTGGRVGVLAAGTADIAAAEEAALLCRELGCTVQTAWDVGVAGLHRLHAPLCAMFREDAPVDVVIVAAGMDGALPAVVAGLVDVPVIGLPTAVGYGVGGDGVGALLSMLQCCVPGLAVVNVDNGIGAGAMAARIANRVAAARATSASDEHLNTSAL